MVISTLWMKEVHAAFHIMLFLALIALIAFILWLFVRYRGKDDIVIDKKLLLIIVCLIFLSTVVLELLCLRSLSNRAMVRAYVTLFGIIIAILSFSLEFSLANSKRNAMERDAIKKILSEANEQYRFEKSMIDLVNVKYHDLKHQLAALDEISKKKLEEDIQPIVEAYDSSFKTGNAALDVILTKENFTCKRKGIELTCAVNGNGLDFMWETEVYSLFGNILDNAIDATERLEDAEKRVISLSVRRQNNFLYISSENYYDGKLVFADGVPRTTKENTDFHGFGLKSVRMIVEKYDGSLKVTTLEDRFRIGIIFTL